MWERLSPGNIITALTTCLALLFSLLVVVNWANPIAVFADENLEAVIREELDQPDGRIYVTDLLTISEIDAAAQNIVSLAGLQYLSNLVSLDLEDNQISNLSPVANLTHLAKLNLRNNRVENITPLLRLTGMRKLDLRGNRIQDIHPLRNMQALEYLNLRDNEIRSIEPLAGMNRLKYLNLHSNVQIESVSALSNLIRLETLILRNVYIGDSIEVLLDLAQLNRLNLRNCGIADTTVLAELMAKGALQDQPDIDRYAEINLLENTQLTHYQDDPTAPIRPYWEQITSRYPIILPPAAQDAAGLSFSHQGGFYEQSFWLEIKHPEPGAAILYTLDGSRPTKASSRYKRPLRIENREHEPNYISALPTSEDFIPPPGNVFKGTVIRAMALLADGETGPVTTYTYFVDPLADERYTMPVLSLSVDETDFFDPADGIYTYDNVFDRGYKWERPAHLEFYDTDGSLAFQQNIGVRIHGGVTRRYGQKSLRLYARKEYDAAGSFNYAVFPGLKKAGSDEPLTEFSTLVLRNAGNDWKRTMLRDGFMQGLVDHLDTIQTQAFRPAILFINGEYWGIHNIRERYDLDYLAYHHGLQEEDLAILSGSAVLKHGSDEDRLSYLDMRRFAEENDLSNDENYHQVASQIDIQNLIDYFTANIYFGNYDWPQNNIDYWRVRPESVNPGARHQDGRWRWLLFDTDFGFGLFTEPQGELYDEFREQYRALSGPESHTLGWVTLPVSYRSGSLWPNILIRQLLENDNFKHQFINAMADQLNSSFMVNRVTDELENIRKQFLPEIDEHIQRWQTIGRSVNHWESNIRQMHDFASLRPDHIRSHYCEVFELPGTVEIKLVVNSDQGTVRVNNLLISSETPGIDTVSGWRGIYFQNVPIQIQAVPEPGYAFTGWAGMDYFENILEIVPDGDFEVQPLFSPK